NRKYSKEKEFRISLSCLQYGHYVLPNGEELQFPESIKLEFDFTKKVVKRLEIRSNHNNNFIREIKQALGNNINIKIL
ncbi:TPA: hypothetical protein KLD66_003028, partial [Legionella pneumophila]|nr:hypothetical protein [Legionella pneumophila]